ncbi:spore germination protein [Bacillus infantis]|uniref:spore germination protein n=1 Tax=Bacillus infantis TaxID=324767 RepID=UPI002155EFC9|nr:spore germination protein [Bacillus infantis]MCR6611089.1 spore germination protein [Bacillus infantis]
MANNYVFGQVVVNGVIQNGNIDIGNNLQNSHTANSKYVGACFAIGDCTFVNGSGINAVQDPDISDQGQIDNPSDPQAVSISK